MEEKRREREAPDDVNEKEMDVIEESNDLNEMEMDAMKEKRREILEALLPPTPIKCENNDLASSSIDQREQHQPNESIIVIKELEELLEFLGDHGDYNLKDILVPQCCIYRVPKYLRKINEAAYTPKVISIGPLHHGEKEFIEMEKQKLRYMLEFSTRVDKEKLKEFRKFIEDKEQDIRNCYQENSTLPSPKFVNMILHDAIFIIEVFLKYWLQNNTDFILHTSTVIKAINRDLQLLENQLPYFVLQKLLEQVALHDVIKAKFPEQDPLLILSQNFLFFMELHVFPKPDHQIQHFTPKPDHQIKHFTDLRRCFLLIKFSPAKEPGKMRDLPIATKLHRSGVKFKKGIEDSLEISCKDVRNAIRIPWIKELELQISRFEIYDDTECLYRNMMALEQCHYPRETHICNFILLMDFLIDTVKDVDLLVDEGIIFNGLGDNAAIAKMFNNICLQIIANPSDSYNISKLKEHYDNRWNQTMETCKTVYFSDIWTGTATVAAVILLVLTFIQTVFSIVK